MTWSYGIIGKRLGQGTGSSEAVGVAVPKCLSYGPADKGKRTCALPRRNSGHKCGETVEKFRKFRQFTVWAKQLLLWA